MGRSDKLYRRLEELEAEYRGLLQRELRRYVKTGYSRVLSNVVYPDKYGPREEVDHIVWLSKEIEILREKVNEPNKAGPVADIRALSKTGIYFYRRSEMQPLVKRIIKRWSKLLTPSPSISN